MGSVISVWMSRGMIGWVMVVMGTDRMSFGRLHLLSTWDSWILKKLVYHLSRYKQSAT